MNRIEHFGAIAASDWVDELHRKLPLPAGCREVLACEIGKLTGRAQAAAERLIRNRPRVRKVIVSLSANVDAPMPGCRLENTNNKQTK